jgi:GH24 family phage-related lysozyme (muramidase)
MANTVPQEAIDLVKEFEGLHNVFPDPGTPNDGLVHAYPDPLSGGEPYTIGWGTTVYPDGRRVRLGETITKEDAEKFLAITLQEQYWQPISAKIPHWPEMDPLMQSALCSFAYNLGADFYGSNDFKTISSCLRERRWSDVPKAMMLYVNPGSNVEEGLKRRRAAEGNLWSRGLARANGSEQPALADEIYEAITETFLKKDKVDSSQLNSNQMVPVVTGKQYKTEEVLQQAGNSIQVQLAYGAGDWWLYLPHWKKAGTVANPAGSPPSLPAQPPVTTAGTRTLLQVPYRSQRDNTENPGGSCNVTSVAMCLLFLGMKDPPGVQLEDDLYRKMEQRGWDRHDPQQLKRMIESFPGYKDIFRVDGSFKDIQSSIDAGNPVIIHGYFTQSGHIVVICGYDDTGFIVNDPNGEWFITGYDKSLSGKMLHYSYGMMAHTCSPESEDQPRNFWYHTVFKV